MSAPEEITSVAQWNTALRTATASGQTVVVDFHAVWCGPCKTIAPKYAQLASSYPQVHFLRVDVDNMKPIAAKYQISAMPTFLSIKAGKVVETLKGADPAGLTRLVKTHAGPNPPVAPLPEAAEAAKTEGNTLFKAGSFAEAAEKYSVALEHAPKSALLFGNRSLAYLKAQEPEKAAEDARQAVALEPQGGKGWVRLGDALMAKGDAATAKGSYKSALDLLPDGLMKTEVKEKLAKLA